jgi:S-adenosylmethionine decarboxylase
MNEPTRRHACARLVVEDSQLLSDSSQWLDMLSSATEQAGATVLDSCAHEFDPSGCSVVLLLSESHASVHTWPEFQIAEVDIYTCGAVDPHYAMGLLIDMVQPAQVVAFDVVLRV